MTCSLYRLTDEKLKALSNFWISQLWLSHTFYIILASGSYKFDLNHTKYDHVAKWELKFDGYTIGGQQLKNIIPKDNYISGDDVVFKGTFVSGGAIIYTKPDNELIAFIDFGSIQEVISGTLNIKWQDLGIFRI